MFSMSFHNSVSLANLVFDIDRTALNTVPKEMLSFFGRLANLSMFLDWVLLILNNAFSSIVYGMKVYSPNQKSDFRTSSICVNLTAEQKFFVNQNDKCSSFIIIGAGVPRSSPLLYLIYTSDISLYKQIQPFKHSQTTQQHCSHTRVPACHSPKIHK